MKENYISTNILRTEFAGSKLAKAFKTSVSFEPQGNKRAKVTNQPGFFDENIRKYSRSDVTKKMLDFLSEQDWSSAGSKTTFNTIQLLNKYGVAKKCYLKDPTKSHKAYLKLDNNNKFYIRNQDQFHYALVNELYDWFDKANRPDIIADMFYNNDGFVFVNEDKISIEDTEKTSSGILRTDMGFYVGQYKIVVEYLENQHDQDKLLAHEFDRVRALRLLGDNKSQSYKIAHVAFFWQKHMFQPEIKRYNFKTGKFYEFVNHIGQVILDYWLISDEDSYCINKLTQITGNPKLSEQIYLAHNNPNVPVIGLSALEKIFVWAKHPNGKIKMEKLWYAEFVDRVKLMQGEILARKSNKKENISAFDELFDSDDEAESEQSVAGSEISDLATESIQPDSKISIPDDELVYYTIKSDDVYLTHFGLHVYIGMDPKYLANMYEYFTIRKFYNDITSGLIDAIKDIRKLKESYQQNQIYGL